MSGIEMLSARSGAGGGARSRSGRSSRRLLHRAHRFARLPGALMSCPGRFIDGGMICGALQRDLRRWWSYRSFEREKTAIISRVVKNAWRKPRR